MQLKLWRQYSWVTIKTIALLAGAQFSFAFAVVSFQTAHFMLVPMYFVAFIFFAVMFRRALGDAMDLIG